MERRGVATSSFLTCDHNSSGNPCARAMGSDASIAAWSERRSSGKLVGSSYQAGLHMASRTVVLIG